MRILTLAAILLVLVSGCTSKDTIARHHDHEKVLAQRQAEYDAIKHIKDRLRTSRVNDTINWWLPVEISTKNMTHYLWFAQQKLLIFMMALNYLLSRNYNILHKIYLACHEPHF